MREAGGWGGSRGGGGSQFINYGQKQRTAANRGSGVLIVNRLFIGGAIIVTEAASPPDGP